jgi:hypothetical protein
MFTSGTTGWKPNPGRLAVADKLTGEWKALGNPCRGTDEEIKTTFRSQKHLHPAAKSQEKQIYIYGRQMDPGKSCRQQTYMAACGMGKKICL